jgi:hypothetical protein
MFKWISLSLLTGFCALTFTTLITPSRAAAAAKEPTAAELDRANKACALNTDNTAIHKLSGGDEVKFVPAKIGDLNDTERAKGCILGKLIAPRKTPGGLAAETYRAYLCKEQGTWCVYWIQDTKIIAKATCEHSNDNQHEPEFQDSGKMIRYWEVKFSY